jgi:pimeloyl-ACP methyl ester carboxylesterase
MSPMVRVLGVLFNLTMARAVWRHNEMLSDRLDQTIELSDGRKMGLAEFGAPEGPVLFSFHSAMSSRLDARWSDLPAHEFGVRVVGLDRPGIGLSDPQPGRKLLDWPKDVAAVADRLGVDRFGVVGWSSGGPYALACAAKIPHRLTGVGLIAGLAPIGLRPMDRFDRSFMFLAKRAPTLLLAFGVAATWFVERIAAREPGRRVPGVSMVFGKADGEVMRAGVKELASSFCECFRCGAQGQLDDEVLVIEPWGFDLQSISLTVHLWQGDADRTMNPAGARAQAERLQHGVLHECPGEGHLLAHAHAHEIVETLVTSQQTAEEPPL